jgi:hypothetical protein
MEGTRPRPGLPPEPTDPLLDGKEAHSFPEDQAPSELAGGGVLGHGKPAKPLRASRQTLPAPHRAFGPRQQAARALSALVNPSFSHKNPKSSHKNSLFTGAKSKFSYENFKFSHNKSSSLCEKSKFSHNYSKFLCELFVFSYEGSS